MLNVKTFTFQQPGPRPLSPLCACSASGLSNPQEWQGKPPVLWQDQPITKHYFVAASTTQVEQQNHDQHYRQIPNDLYW